MTPAELMLHLRASWRPFLFTHLLFTLLAIAILTPLFSLLFRATLWLTGTTAAVDQDIALLLLSPAGFGGAVLLIAVLLAIVGLELGALLLIARANHNGVSLGPANAIGFSFSHAKPIMQLTLGLTLRVLGFLLPYLAIVAVLAFTLLTEYDINYYLAEQPPVFTATVGVAILLALPLLWLMGRKLLGWSLVLPLVLIEGVRPTDAFAASANRVGEQRRLCLRALLSWLLVAGLLALLPALLLNIGMKGILASGLQSLATLALLLGVIGAAWGVLNFLVSALNLGAFCVIVNQLHIELGGKENLPEHALREPGQRLPGFTPLVAIAFVALLAVSTLLLMVRPVQFDDTVLIIAHRGAAGAAPENTLASINRALADGADWVEIDVQESQDGAVIVVHDSDFMKLAGDPIKVWEGSLDRLQQIDIGSWFDPGFASERVPTLEEVLTIIRDSDANLVIELKYYGHDVQLEQRVINVVEAAGMAERIAVMSLKLEGIHKLKQLRPEWTGGLLAATAIGDITQLDTNFLAVSQAIASPGFIRRAHKAGKQVFVWTVNDALSMTHWMSMGVDGIITDEPELARQVLAQRESLGTAERLLLSAVLYFGNPEVLKQYRDSSP